jgi:hypothetical protein
MLFRVAVLSALAIALSFPALAATDSPSSGRSSLGDAARRAPPASSPPAQELQAVTTMEATAATVGEDAPAPGHTRYRFNVPVDISGAPTNVTMFVACRALNQAGTRRVREWRRVGNRIRWGRERNVPVNENLAIGIADVPLRNGLYKGQVRVDIDLPSRGEMPESYICQLEYRTMAASGLPTGSYACQLGTREGSECSDMVKGNTSAMQPN